MKIDIVEREERKTAARVPAACGYLKMERNLDLGVELGGGFGRM